MKLRLVLFFIFFLSLIAVPNIFLFSQKIVDDQHIAGLPNVLFVFVLVSYLFLTSFLFFYCSGLIFSFAPENNNKKSEINVVKNKIIDYFSGTDELKKVFTVDNPKDNELIITWSKDVKYNQLIAIGEKSIKSVMILKFLPNSHKIQVVTKIVDMDWNFSGSGFNLSKNYKQGIWLDYSDSYQPSYEVVDGKPVLQIKRLKFDSMELYGPLLKIGSLEGWNVSFKMFFFDNIIAFVSLFISVMSLIIGLYINFKKN